MKRKSSLALLTTMTICLASGCGTTGTTTAPETTSGATAEVAPTEETVAVAEAEAAEATPEVAEVVEPTEVEATPTEEVVEDNPNVIEGVDFTSFNEENMVLSYAMYGMKFDVPRLVVTRRVEMSFDTERKVMCILSDGDKFTEEPVDEKPEHYEATRYEYSIYAPKAIKDVSYNQRKIEYNLEGVEQTFSADLINGLYSKSWEMDGIEYPESYHFYLDYNAVVNDEEIIITIDYEDGTSDQMTVYLTKDYVE